MTAGWENNKNPDRHRGGKNYVKPVKELKTVVPVEKPFTLSSKHGSSEVKQKCVMNIDGQVSSFLMLDTLTSFDAIIGFDLLTRGGVALNFTDVDATKVPNSVSKKFKATLLKRAREFSISNEALPCNTTVIATIRTTDNKPVYSKFYAHPMGVQIS